MIEDSIRGLPNVTASSFDGLLADYADRERERHRKGLRAMSDFEYEFQMALINQKDQSGRRDGVCPPARNICL